MVSEQFLEGFELGLLGTIAHRVATVFRTMVELQHNIVLLPTGGSICSSLNDFLACLLYILHGVKKILINLFFEMISKYSYIVTFLNRLII
jgi:hypothetical protein